MFCQVMMRCYAPEWNAGMALRCQLGLRTFNFCVSFRRSGHGLLMSDSAASTRVSDGSTRRNHAAGMFRKRYPLGWASLIRILTPNHSFGAGIGHRLNDCLLRGGRC